ncbi:hypothetical protein K8Q94_00915 [Candidatus Nomurabacteria bacterium]|nr:hypothetical protein [Candidatus Nomurabacteria bacterium]
MPNLKNFNPVISRASTKVKIKIFTFPVILIIGPLTVFFACHYFFPPHSLQNGYVVLTGDNSVEVKSHRLNNSTCIRWIIDSNNDGRPDIVKSLVADKEWWVKVTYPLTHADCKEWAIAMRK